MLSLWPRFKKITLKFALETFIVEISLLHISSSAILPSSLAISRHLILHKNDCQEF